MTSFVLSGGAVFLIDSTTGHAPTIREAVIAWVKRVGGASVNGRVYQQNPSQINNYPCYAVKLTDRTYGHRLDGADGSSIATFDIMALAAFESQAVALAEIIRNNADGFRGTQSGVAILRCFLDGENDDTSQPIDGSDQWIYEVTVTYAICHRVAFPTSVAQTNV